MRIRSESLRRLRRLRRRHGGKTGVFVVGRFSLFRMSLRRPARVVATVQTKRKRVSLHQRKRGPKWLPLAPGKEHLLQVITDGHSSVEVKVKLKAGEHRVLYVEPLNNGQDIVRLMSPGAFDA